MVLGLPTTRVKNPNFCIDATLASTSIWRSVPWAQLAYSMGNPPYRLLMPAMSSSTTLR